MIKEWYFRDAKWWQFWRPQSGLIGGLILDAVLFLAVCCFLLCGCATERYDSQGNGTCPGDKVERALVHWINHEHY